MFHTLVASHPQGSTSVHRFALSATLHVALVLGAVVLTRQASLLAGAPAPQPIPIFTAPAPSPLPMQPRRPSTASRPMAAAPTPAAPTPAFAPPAMGLEPVPRLPAPSLPTVGDLLRATSLPPSTAPPAPAGDHVRTSGTVDQPIEVVMQPPPRYPAGLAVAGIVGRVEVSFVVDTLGHAEPGSVRMTMSTHPGFEAAARASVMASVFRPARWNGRPVRQLVRQAFSFRAP